MIEPDQKYIVRISSAITTKSDAKGTLGLNLNFVCEEGSIAHTIWCSPASRDNAKKSIMAMGVLAENLSKLEFWQNPMKFLKESTCQIVTQSEEYEGKLRTRVKYVNPPSFAKAAPPEAHDALAEMFAEDADDVPFN